ncbi:MAG TPA: hypothetical protein VMT86_17550 [Bryobacteraceae bacterium]|nr:hypothetical protein [Bryobacteraceae bacterium]
MLDLNIETLSLTIENAAGHEHRIHAIVLRASAILARRIEEKYGENGAAPGAADADSLTATPAQVDLKSTSNEQAAYAIATAWFDAIALHLES